MTPLEMKPVMFLWNTANESRPVGWEYHSSEGSKFIDCCAFKLGLPR